MAYDVVRHPGAGAFLARAEPWLLRGEDRNNLLLSLAYARAGSGAGADDTFLATVRDGGDVVGCVLRTPPHKALVTEIPPGAGRAIAAALGAADTHVPGVLGPVRAAEAVAAAWVEVHGGVWRPGLEHRVYRLDEVVPPPRVPGRLRLARPEDTELVVEWGEGFARDAGTQFTVRRASVEGWIEAESLFVWDDDGPRSIAVAHGRTPHGVRIGYVYTPPEHRRRGYAARCVAEVSQRMLDAGLDFCVLYTDRANPTSNAVYRRIGYRLIQEVRDVDILQAEIS